MYPNEHCVKGLVFLMQVTHKQLMPGVHLTAVHTNKFKSSYFGVNLLTPLDREWAAEHALIPSVLRRGSENYPDMQALSAALDELYGGAVEPVVTKKGEVQCVGFAAGFLEDTYALNGEPVLEAAAQLLGELLLHPCTENGVFRRDYVESERSNLVDRIRAQMNDKRQYSLHRLAQEMCRDEAFGVDKLGDEAHAQAITPDSLWKRYQTLLSTAQVELYYCGSADLERVEQALRSALSDLPVSAQRQKPVSDVQFTIGRKEPQIIEDRLEVTQGKLAMGLRTGGISVKDEAFPALMLLNAVFGGTSMSKLFMNVREKLSLCYFASSMLEKFKGLMLVSSGIEFEKYRQARGEILAQMEACRRGEITGEELEGARRIVMTALHTTLDSQSRLADFWLGQAVAGLEESPEQLARRIENVSVEQVAQAARKLQLDTIYFLNGTEGAQ